MSAAPDSRPVTAGTSPLDAVTTRFQHAAATSGVVERAYVIAGRSVTMRFAGTAMLDRLSGSFSHLLAEHRGERALRINIWDSSSTSTEAPPVLGDASATDASGAIYYFQDDSVRAITRWETLSVYDSATHEAWFWAPEAARMLSWDWAAPMRAIFHWWLGERGMIQVHGGAVGIEAGGALVVGSGGSGKSTTTLACLESGLAYAGDDFVAIAPHPSPYVHSLYSTGKLESHHLQRFPGLIEAVANPEREPGEKAIVYPVHNRVGLATTGFPLRAVLVPRVAGTPSTRVVPISAAAALQALAPSTIFQLHPPQVEGLRVMAAIVRDVPCYSLELGTEIDRIPSVIAELLEHGWHG